jgi:hypothetical protein
MAESRKSVAKKRVLPRASTAAGGPMPCVDYRSLAALQEMDDLKYVGRMKEISDDPAGRARRALRGALHPPQAPQPMRRRHTAAQISALV